MRYGPVSIAGQAACLPRPRARAWMIGLSSFCGLAVAGAFTVVSSESLVSNAFETAFAGIDRPAVREPVARIAAAAFDGVEGSEEFWLRAENANSLKALVVGQKITLNANGQARHLLITNVSDEGDAATHIQTTVKQARVLVLTCREGDAKSGRDVALRLEAGQIVEVPLAPAARVQRAL